MQFPSTATAMSKRPLVASPPISLNTYRMASGETPFANRQTVLCDGALGSPSIGMRSSSLRLPKAATAAKE